MFKIYDRNEDGKLVPSEATVMHFYGGEVHVKNLEESSPAAIVITGANADEIITAAMVADAAHQKGNDFELILPYLPAARADRGNPFGAKVYADIINTMQAEKVSCVDPHSPTMPALVNHINIFLIEKVIEKYINDEGIQYAGIISPDEGSRQRSGVIANHLGLPLIYASKHRNFETGKLTGFTCDPVPDPDGIYLVVDDICDGGGTFMGLAEAIGLPKNQLHLWVSHGVFSGRAPQLNDAYDKIITTNSHPGHDNPEVGAHIIDIIEQLIN
jgi:ribose-phosphate pyrophosphokinase